MLNRLINLLKEEESLKRKLETYEQNKVLEQAKKINDAFRQIGDDIATGITDALVGAIQGTKSLGEAAKVNNVNDLAIFFVKAWNKYFTSRECFWYWDIWWRW